MWRILEKKKYLDRLGRPTRLCSSRYLSSLIVHTVVSKTMIGAFALRAPVQTLKNSAEISHAWMMHRTLSPPSESSSDCLIAVSFFWIGLLRLCVESATLRPGRRPENYGQLLLRTPPHLWSAFIKNTASPFRFFLLPWDHDSLRRTFCFAALTLGQHVLGVPLHF